MNWLNWIRSIVGAKQTPPRPLSERNSKRKNTHRSAKMKARDAENKRKVRRKMARKSRAGNRTKA